MGLIHIGGKAYELVHENRNGFNAEAFRDRYSEVLERYDFIIGDWGYNQLRLKGFFRDNHQKATKDCNFSSMSDYINEYCNFGCAYFILEKTQSTKKEPDDYDLDDDDQRPRLEAADIRAAVEAGYSAAIEAEDSAEDEVASTRENAFASLHERHSRGNRGNHRHNGSNRHSNENRSGGDQSNAVEGMDGSESRGNGEHRNGSGKRDYPQRKNNRGNDQRGKKPFRLAANETAAAAAGNNGPNKKGTEHS
ncbi:YutD-like domain-containing protein [Paenibacillus sp. sgz302251]|uniref:YutD family protein n=1 Tax=Paenibacillus sp. sgz302251 TaxID=3414493 RepID=UPI003C7B1812